MYKIVLLFVLLTVTEYSYAQKILELSNSTASVKIERQINGDKASFILKEITGKGGKVDLSSSPIWQIDIRRIFPSGGGLMKLAPDILIPDIDVLTSGVLELDSSKIVWEKENDTLISLMWKDIVIIDDTLNVKMEIVLQQNDTGPNFNLESKITGSGQFGINSVRFPLITVPAFDSPDNDQIAFPFSGGRLLKDPIHVHHKWQDSTSSMSSLRWNYPATMQQQFLYYSDGGKNNSSGIYLASDDGEGTFKRLYFSPDKTGNKLLMYLRHFNGADPDSNVFSKFRSFSLMTDYGYRCNISILQGDWQRAADVYRKKMLSLTSAQNGFLKKGKLYNRTDLTKQVKNTFLMMQHKVTPWPNPVDITENPNDGVVSDLEREIAIVKFLSRDVPNLHFLDQINNYLGGGEPDIPTNDRGLTGGSFRENLPEYISKLKATFGKERTLLGYNQDTGAWLKLSYVNEMERSIIKLSNYGAYPYEFASGPTTKTMTCQGSSYILERRFNNCKEVLRLSDYNGNIGFDVAMWSGQGTHTKLCYAPADDNTDRTLHNHFIGGGTFWTDEWRASIENALNSLISDHPNMVMASERGHEQLIDNTIRSGHGETWPYNDYERTIGDEMPNAYAIPINDYIWHDYAVLIANKTSNYYPRDIMTNPPHRRLELIQDFLAGRILTMPVGAKGFKTTSPENYGAPSELLFGRLLDLKYLRTLITAKANFLQFLSYGKFLHYPEIKTTKTDLPFVVAGNLKLLPIPTVWGCSFKAPVDWKDNPTQDANSIGLIFSNFTEEQSDFSFSVNYSLPELSRVILFDTSGVSFFNGPFSQGEDITIPALSVLVAVYGGYKPTDIKNEDEIIPIKFELEQNYPNPFNPTTTIEYSIPSLAVQKSQKDFASVQLKIFDVLGREITTLVNKVQRPGKYKINFDASGLTSGVYFYRLSVGSFVSTRKMLLLE